MRSRKREIGEIVVKPAFSGPGGMAFKAGLAVVYISSNFAVLVIHVSLVVLMATDAGELGIIA